VLVTGDTSSLIKQLPLDEALRCVSEPIDPDAFLALTRELLAREASGRTS
jgi:hypothetical protein